MRSLKINMAQEESNNNKYVEVRGVRAIMVARLMILLVVVFFIVIGPVYRWVDYNYEFDETKWELLEEKWEPLVEELKKRGYQVTDIRKGKGNRSKSISCTISVVDFNEGFDVAAILRTLNYSGTYSTKSSEDNFYKAPYRIELLKIKTRQQILISLRLEYSDEEITKGILKKIFDN